jgi:hypothetical protein
MRQGRNLLGLMTVLAASSLVCGALAAHAAPGKTPANGLHQFTGIVTSVDKATLTVENPRTVVFTRHAEMKTTGEIDKNARVTVFYRDEGGKSIAHRVVAKPGRSRAPNAGS